MMFYISGMGLCKVSRDNNSAVLSSTSEMLVCGNSCSALSDPFYSGGI